MGVGQADQFRQVFSGGEGGVGENMYLELLVSVGPLGLLALLVWLAGLVWRMATVRRRAPPVWMVVGTWAALLGYAAVAMLAAPLMRFTTWASVWLAVGLCVDMVLASRHSTEEPDAIGAGATASSSVE